MKPTTTATRLTVRLASARPIVLPSAARQLHSTSPTSATVSSAHGNGPPPGAPVTPADNTVDRLERRKKQAAMLRAARDIRAAESGISKAKAKAAQQPVRKRFWKDVHVKEVNGAWEVHLDTRALRHPTTKNIIRLPLSKPMLAYALALEWDLLVSVQQATRHHLIPLTSLTCRAIDIAEDDDAVHSTSATSVSQTIRSTIARTVMRYLDTDSLLCWAPPPPSYDVVEGKESLRDLQKRTAEDVIGYLTTRVWPGVTITPVLDGESIMPRKQDEATRSILEGWVMGLNSWDLAGLERAVLAGKSLLGAARLVVDWSDTFADTRSSDSKRFGVEEAAKATSLEVDWQTGKWGEVEDTHDVEKEDVRRQLGSVVLLVSETTE